MENLTDVAAIITGGASGMGAATAKCLASQGVKVALLDMDIDKAKELANSINGLAFECDVSNEESAMQAINEATEAHGPARLCVNCAGIVDAKRIVGREGPMALADFSKIINVNLIGTFNIMRLAAATMMTSEPDSKTGERGVIVNTASIAAYEGQIGQVAYSASKGGVVAITLPAAREFAKHGIRVMTIAPGIIQTPMMDNMPEEVQQSLAEAIPFPKRLGTAEEYAKLALHIIHNAYLNGEVIRLDGAIRMQPK